MAPMRRGLLVGAAAAVVFGGLLLGYELSWPWVLGTDSAVIRALAPYADTYPGWVVLLEVLTNAFGPATWRILAVLALVLTLQRQAYRHAVLLFIGPVLGGLAMEGVKRLVDRPRPAEAVTTAFSSSFPSGHAFGVTVGVLSLLYLAWPALGRVRRHVAAAIGSTVVLAVGFTRLALVVHHLSDVLAGTALGVLWVILCLGLTRPALDPWWSRQVVDDDTDDTEVTAATTPADTR